MPLLDPHNYLAGVFPPLAACVRSAACRFPLTVVAGLRSYAEQDALWEQGRLPGDKRRVITQSKGGQSWHNFGLAVDVTPLDGGWNAPAEAWDVLGAALVEAGLEWGGHWRKFVDRPHAQLVPDGYVLGHARRDFAGGGLPVVWHVVTERLVRRGVTP
jgi:hypothetical protein